MSCIYRSFSYLAASYQAFKAIESNKPEDIKKWARFWVLLGFYTAAQPFLDMFLFWVPLYSEAKLATLMYLWVPGLQGAGHVYQRWLQPTLLEYEPVIDQKLNEGRAQMGDFVIGNMGKFLVLLREKGALLLAQVQQQAQLKAGPPEGAGKAD
ncbi:hypothetical protein N2152v2_008867 [Parachlorella kessleri]